MSTMVRQFEAPSFSQIIFISAKSNQDNMAVIKRPKLCRYLIILVNEWITSMNLKYEIIEGKKPLFGLGEIIDSSAAFTDPCIESAVSVITCSVMLLDIHCSSGS
jgi:energy-converting hydrogenase Eha subunit A